MPRPDRSHALDHVVVIMFENRSFDNLLGRLYEPGEVASFEGVIGRDLSNPVPEWADASGKLVPYGLAPHWNTPNPDPGEEYQHVNTQLFGVIDPPANRGVHADQMAAPYNAPVNPWIPERTVINEEYRHTSVIRTLRERWQLGAPLTSRDGAARDLAPVLSLDTPRAQEDWPQVTPRPVPPFNPDHLSMQDRLRGLPKAALFPVLALCRHLGLPAPGINEDEALCRNDAVAIISDVFWHMFPGLHAG
jgi:hypothetical protein